jgi:hypothetical protein
MTGPEFDGRCFGRNSKLFLVTSMLLSLNVRSDLNALETLISGKYLVSVNQS